MNYASIPTTADVTAADFGKPPKLPHRSTWMLAAIAVLVVRFGLSGSEEPDLITAVIFTCLIVSGLLEVVGWAVRLARFAAARGPLRGFNPLS